MDVANLMTTFSGLGFINLFFKAFAILFSLMFIIYAIVISKQTQVMSRTLKDNNAGLFGFVSFIQILVALGLFLLSVFLI